MKARVRYERLTQYKRVIALSDIHGDFDGFHGLLQALRFSPEDALVIVGDIVEKGPNSLKLLRYVMASVMHLGSAACGCYDIEKDNGYSNS